MPPRRSESPEGVGDLLKQESLDFEEDESMPEPREEDAPTDAAPELKRESEGAPTEARDGRAAAEQIASSGSGGGRRGQQNGAKAFRAKGPARYFIVKSNNHSNIENSIKNGIWATQVCH